MSNTSNTSNVKNPLTHSEFHSAVNDILEKCDALMNAMRAVGLSNELESALDTVICEALNDIEFCGIIESNYTEEL